MVIIIPVKPFNQAKTRLSTILSPAERLNLSRYLFRRTLHIARQLSQVVVISRDAVVRKMAKQMGAWALVETGTSLNEALRQATDWAILNGTDAVLVLPSDLPRLTVTDLADLIAGEQGSRGAGEKILLRPSPAVVIAPCRRLRGTNALLLRPPSLIPFSFGPNSFDRHQQAARSANVEPIIYHSPALAFDLDVPGDLALLDKEGETL